LNDAVSKYAHENIQRGFGQQEKLTVARPLHTGGGGVRYDNGETDSGVHVNVNMRDDRPEDSGLG